MLLLFYKVVRGNTIERQECLFASALFKLQCEKGAASVFIHDQGTEFKSCVNNELCCLMDITKRIATAYHPMTNGLDERWNGTLQTALRKVIDHDCQDD